MLNDAWPELTRAHANHYRREYDITLDDYLGMFLDQMGCCAICNASATRERKLFVDHCHVTGRVRGLLCDNCNKGIGMLGDDVIVLHAAIIYLTR